MSGSHERKVLVTGAAGFVGRHLVTELLAKGYSLTGLGRNLRPPDLPKSVDWLQVDLEDDAAVASVVPREWWGVAHLAGRTVPSELNGVNGVMANVRGTLVLADRVAAGARFLYVSSCHVYRAAHGPHSEGEMPLPKGRYGLSKLLCEQAVLAQTDRLDVRIARPFNHLGAGMQPTLAVPSLLRRIAADGATERPLRMLGLDSVRDFLDVRDIVHAYEAILRLEEPESRIFNVCSSEPVTIGALARTALSVAGYSREVEFEQRPSSQDDTPMLVGSNALLREATGWSPEHSLEDALRAAIMAR